MDEGSKTKKKKKRGKSLIFKTCFRQIGLGDNNSGNGGKVLASDDNLIYCDVTGNVVDPQVKKSSSSRGRMSRIFKAVLFDTAMKKKLRGKKSSKALTDATSLPPLPNEKFDNSFKVINDSNVVEKANVDDSSNDDQSNEFSSTLETTTSPISSSCVSSFETESQVLIEQTVSSSQVESIDKNPLLSLDTQLLTKPIEAKDGPSLQLDTQPLTKPKDRKLTTLNNSKVRLCTIIILGLFVLMVLWKIYMAITFESSDTISEQDKNVIITRDEL